MNQDLPNRRQLAGGLLASALCASAVNASRPASAGEQGESGVDDPVGASYVHPDRPADDRRRDPNRRPDRVLDFFDIKRGMRVADLMAGDGYFTEILARAVGPGGHVYCQNTAIPLRVFADEPLSARLARLEEGGVENVTRLDREFDDSGLPEGLDAAILIRFYHDFEWQEVDRPAFNQLVFRVLAPGAVFGVVDHQAASGAGITGSKSLHRVEGALVREEVEAAGFQFEAQSYVLANPEDTHDWNIFRDGAVDRDRTDRFVYLFRKPE